MKDQKNCGTCHWHDDYSGSCFNGDSPNRGDFTGEDDCCSEYGPRNPSRGMNPQERTRAAVYATGNKWAKENFDATH